MVEKNLFFLLAYKKHHFRKIAGDQNNVLGVV
jgi:hypothetical protein